jgi:hypothetical protein
MSSTLASEPPHPSLHRPPEPDNPVQLLETHLLLTPDHPLHATILSLITPDNKPLIAFATKISEELTCELKMAVKVPDSAGNTTLKCMGGAVALEEVCRKLVMRRKELGLGEAEPNPLSVGRDIIGSGENSEVSGRAQASGKNPFIRAYSRTTTNSRTLAHALSLRSAGQILLLL